MRLAPTRFKAHGMVLLEAAAMGFDVGGLTAEGLCAGDEAMVLVLLWQLAHAVLLAPVNVRRCPELETLLLPGEEVRQGLTLQSALQSPL